MLYSIDAIENGKARLCADDMQSIYVQISSLPTLAKEGDIVEKIGDSFVLNNEETKKRRQNIKEKLDFLLKK